MPVDSRNKRGSVLNLGGPFYAALPAPTVTPSVGDRAALAYLYFGLIEAGSASAATLTDIRDGLVDRLATISGLRVYSSQMNSIQEYPCAVVILDTLDYVIAIGGYSFQGQFRVVMLTDSGIVQDAHEQLDPYLDPSGAQSVTAAILADDTLGGTVDGLVVQTTRNVRRIPDTDLVAADISVQFVKQVLP